MPPITRNLSAPEIIALLQTVFALRRTEKGLTFLVDLPTDSRPDTPEWLDRRRIAIEWFVAMEDHLHALPFSSIRFSAYDNVGSNNNDLPDIVMIVDGWSRSARLASQEGVKLAEILADSSVVLAFTELSATAPLKVLGRLWKFRGATLPGFSRAMIPALRLDFEKIDARVGAIKELMDGAEGATLSFDCGGRKLELFIDLRHRPGIASGGLIREEGNVANLPSGEAYIVPYEGERKGEPSRTSGMLPVQIGVEIVEFRIEQNRAVEVTSRGKQSTIQKDKLRAEPAYGNIAELGVGVLGEWGIRGIGRALLDEKLGLHVAFGRSDHFGGMTAPAAFHDKRNVIHIDWVYVPTIQPQVLAREAWFHFATKQDTLFVRNGRVVV